MALTFPARRLLGLALAVAGAATALGTATAGAAPGPRLGAPQVARDVLGPADPAFWNAAAPGTRVLTPVDPRDDVICLSGFVPVLNCWTTDRHLLAAPMRPLAHVDVPVLGGPPLRIWVDLPRWGDGSTGEGSIRELTEDVIIWWLTNPATPS